MFSGIVTVQFTARNVYFIVSFLMTVQGSSDKIREHSYGIETPESEFGESASSLMCPPSRHQLVLDLDHTLISSFEFGESPPPRRSINTVSPILTEEYKDEYGLPELYHATISNVVVLIKLRPHVRKFVKQASEQGMLLHVYTKGRRSYMNEIIRLIDPDGCIKGKRVSRDDEPSYFRDNQKDPALIDDMFSSKHKQPFIVLDDSPVVWSACASYAEVIGAQRYCFSDKFVTFLRSMERSVIKAGAYPHDVDDYLIDILNTHVKESSMRLSSKLAVSVSSAPVVVSDSSFSPLFSARTLTMSTTVEETDDESYSPISAWSSKPVTLYKNESSSKVTVTLKAPFKQ